MGHPSSGTTMGDCRRQQALSKNESFGKGTALLLGCFLDEKFQFPVTKHDFEITWSCIQFSFQIEIVKAIGQVSEGMTASLGFHFTNQKIRKRILVEFLSEAQSGQQPEWAVLRPALTKTFPVSSSMSQQPYQEDKSDNWKMGAKQLIPRQWKSTSLPLYVLPLAREETCSSRTLIPIANIIIKYLCITIILHDTSRR